MRRTIAVAALLGMLFATPAMASIVYTPQPETGDYGDVGLVDPGDSVGSINTVFVDPAYFSDVYEFDFAIHMSSIWYNASLIHFSFAYDNSSIDVLGASPIGGWTENNFDNYDWPHSGIGEIVVNSLTMGFTQSSNYEPFATSSVVPFLHVTLHVNSSAFSALNDFGVVAVELVSHTYALTLLPGDFAYFGGTIHEVPEPATATLLFGGIAALMGGVIRRRR